MATAVIEYVHATPVRPERGDAVAQFVVLTPPAEGLSQARKVVAVVFFADIADRVVNPAQAGIAVLGFEQAAGRVVAEVLLAARRAAFDQPAGAVVAVVGGDIAFLLFHQSAGGVVTVAGDGTIEAGFRNHPSAFIVFKQVVTVVFIAQGNQPAQFVVTIGQRVAVGIGAALQTPGLVVVVMCAAAQRVGNLEQGDSAVTYQNGGPYSGPRYQIVLP